MSAAPAASPNRDRRNYALVTAAYWADTLTDGALRMLVLLHFHREGYSPLEVATLFLFYEAFGVVTNLVGGFIGARLGLKVTLFAGLAVQIVAVSMLGVPTGRLSIAYVMIAQALSGIAKDLTKMSSKSAVKRLVGDGKPTALFRWTAILTGSKNAMKGVGFFVGGLLLALIGFRAAIFSLDILLLLTLATTALLFQGDLGAANKTAKFRGVFSQNRSINILAAARVMLFASRDVWFAVGLPVFFSEVLGWSFWTVGGFMALWIIGYGVVQTGSPKLLSRIGGRAHRTPDGGTAQATGILLAVFPTAIALLLLTPVSAAPIVVFGLIAFGIVFALNSSIHSYLILAYSDGDRVAMQVGFYYTANALGRLFGTILSGLLYQAFGLVGCLAASGACALAAGIIARYLPTTPKSHRSRADVKADD